MERVVLPFMTYTQCQSIYVDGIFKNFLQHTKKNPNNYKNNSSLQKCLISKNKD